MKFFFWIKMVGVLGLSGLWAAPAWSQGESFQSFTYQGRLLDTSNNPVLDSVSLKLEIFNNNKDCLLYEETQTIDTSSSNGFFAVQVGSAVGAAKRGSGDRGFAMAQIMQNITSFAADPGSCASGYTPQSGDGRFLRVTLTPAATGVPEVLSPDVAISSTPSALVAESVQGLDRSKLLELGTQAALTQANLEKLVDGSDVANLHNHDGAYMKLGASVAQDLGSGVTHSSGQLSVGTSSPAAGVELEIQNNDPTLRLDATDGAAGTASLEFTDSIGTAEASLSVQEGTQSLVVRTGSTTALTINAAQQVLFSQFIRSGQFTNADEAGSLLTALSGCGATCKGAQWANTDSNTLKYWDGAAIQTVASSSGVSAVTASLPLASSGGTTPNLSLNLGNGVKLTGSNLEVNAASEFGFSSGQLIISSGGVLSTHILDGTVDTADLASDAVSNAKILDGTIQVADLDTGSVDARYVNITGDTLTGALTLPSNGLTVGGSELAVSSGRVGIGTAAPTQALTTFSGGAEGSGGDIFFHGVSNAEAIDVSLNRARGTIGGETDINNGDKVGGLKFQGFHSAAYHEAAEIRAVVDAAPGNADMPSSLQFMTSADGAASPTTRMTIANSGNVGIGTTTPASQLDISNALQMGLVSTTAEVRADGTNAFLLLLGIQEATPAHIVVAQGGSQPSSFTNNGSIEVVSNDGSTSDIMLKAFDSLIFRTGSAQYGTVGQTPSMVIEDNGFVGIGDSTPSSALDVNGTIRAVELCDETGGNCQDLSAGGGGGGDVSNNGNTFGAVMTVGTNDAFDLNLETGNVSRINIDSGGDVAIDSSDLFVDISLSRVGFGTTSPAEKVHTFSNGSNHYIFSSAGQISDRVGIQMGVTGFGIFAITHQENQGRLDFGEGNTTTAAASNPLMSLTNGGNLGIGTTAPLNKLDVRADIRVGTGTTGCVLDADGTNIAGTCSSDRRFKRNIATVSPVLERLTKMEVVTYDWRHEEFPERHWGEQTQLGVIAQQVQEHMPELVVEDEDGFLKVKFSDLPMHLLQATKDLHNRCEMSKEQLQAQIDRLREENRALNDRVSKLEAEMAAIRRALSSLSEGGSL